MLGAKALTWSCVEPEALTMSRLTPFSVRAFKAKLATFSVVLGLRVQGGLLP